MTTHEEKKKRIKKLRGIQWLMSAAGVIIIAWGLWEVACLFMDYRWKETTNDAQIEQYLSPVNLRASGYTLFPLPNGSIQRERITRMKAE